MRAVPGWRRGLPAYVMAGLGLATMLLGTAAQGELLEVRQIAAGMECPECARGLRLLAQSIPGVEAAETSWNRRILTLHFRAGSPATLAQVRSIVLRQHFQVREAEIVVAGRLHLDAVTSAASLFVPESGLTYRIELSSPPIATNWAGVLSAAAGQEVVVTARVPAGTTAEDPLVLWPLALRVRVPIPRP
jgi:hypothetical protein